MEMILYLTEVLHKQAMHVVSFRKQIVLGPLQEFPLLPMVMFDKCLLARKTFYAGKKKNQGWGGWGGDPILPFAQSTPHVAAR